MNAPVQMELTEAIERARTVTGEQVREEHTRRVSNREALVGLLADGQWHTNSELHAVAGFRYGARIYELRQAGHVVHAQDIARGRWQWRLDPSRTVLAECIGPCCLCREPGAQVPTAQFSREGVTP